MGHVLVWSLVFLLLNTLLCEQAKGQSEENGLDASTSQTGTETHRAVLTLHPHWSEIFYGEAFTLRCHIQDGGNTGWTYEWTRNTLSIHVTTNEYSIASPTTAHRGSYRCRGRTDSSLTTEWSDVIELTVRDRPTAKLSIDTRYIDHGGVTLTCSLSSSSGWKYYWYKDKRLYKPQNTQRYSDDSYITVPPGGTYQCRGGRGDPVYYSSDSNSVVIPTAVLTLKSNWSEIFHSETVTLRCDITGGGDTEWVYLWSPSDPGIPQQQSGYLTIRADFNNSRRYYCMGENKEDRNMKTGWSNYIDLNVLSNPPLAHLTSDTTSIQQGSSVTLTCSVSSSSGWKYYWYKDNRLYKPKNTQLYSDDPYITVPPGGTYQCRGGRGDPVYYSSDSNSVVIPTAVLTLKSNWSEMFNSETVTLRCDITGGGDTEWVYLWYTSGPSIPQQQSEYLTIRADFNNSRRYHCKGENKEDRNMKTGWSNPISLNVLSNPPLAHLTSDTTSIQQGSSVTLTCSVSSSSGWKYYWYNDSTLYKPHTTQDFTDNPQISVSVGGRYRCRGGRGNPVYYTSTSNTLSISTIVSNRAVVTLDPNWSEIYTGEKITLRCEIHGGDTEWEYEWRQSGSAMYERESEIRITKTYSGLTGNYSCRGKMKQSQVHSTNWSDNVTLTVSVDKPSSVLTVCPSWLSPGATITLKCHVKHPSAGWRFYWYKAVPQRSQEPYRYELLPDSSEGTEQEVFTIHGQKDTRGYVCRAGRGDPQFYSEYSQPKFVWRGDTDSTVSLTVSPDRGQHFTNESVSLSCETNSTGWRVRQFYDNRYSKCDTYSWRNDTYPCTVSRTVYNGTVFWCESGSGEMSNAVNISTHNEIILESPVYPVTEGQTLILGCKLWTDGIIPQSISFYKNGKLIQTGTSEQLNIAAVSKSDEGLYKCEIKETQSRRSLVWLSPESWVSVKSFPRERSSFPVGLIIGSVTGIFLMILLPLIVLGWYKKSKGVCCTRFVESLRSTQGSSPTQTINQDENQQQVYSSLLHGDLCVYDTIRGSGNTGHGEQHNEYEMVLSQRHDAEDEDYCNVVKPPN